MQVARDLMRVHGVGALNLNEVARRVGMKTPSLYEYFAGKMAIYDALYMQGVLLYSQSVNRTSFFDAAEFWQLVEQSIYSYMEFAYRYPELYNLVFERPVPEFIPSEASMVESRRLLQSSNPIFQQAIDTGVIRPGVPVEQARDIFITLLHGLTSLQMANEPHLPPGQGRFGSLIPAVTQLLKAAWSS